VFLNFNKSHGKVVKPANSRNGRRGGFKSNATVPYNVTRRIKTETKWLNQFKQCH